MHVMDMTGDGEDNIVACWWDGHTLIVDRDRNVVAFKFADRVSAFLCGNYAVQKHVPAPSLVYVTFYGEIIVYHNVRLDTVPVYTLKDKTNTAEWDAREVYAPNTISTNNYFQTDTIVISLNFVSFEYTCCRGVYSESTQPTSATKGREQAVGE